MEGPVVVHVPIKEPGQQRAHEHLNKGSKILPIDSSGKTRRRQRSPCFLVVIGGLVLLVTVLVIWEQNLAMEKKSSLRPKTMFDVNAPPFAVQDDDDYDRKALTFWGNFQDDRQQGLGYSVKEDRKYKESMHGKNTGKKKKNKFSKHGSRKSVFSFPVVAYDDDAIPQGVSGSVAHAADALLCRDTVIDYVINATDLRDECDGLKKAFTKTCTDEADDVEEMPVPSKRQRLLYTKNVQQYEPRPMIKQANPLMYFHFRFRKLWQCIRDKWFQDHDSIFLAEEAVIREWDNAQYEVQNDFDMRLHEYFDAAKVRTMRSRQHRFLEYALQTEINPGGLLITNKTRPVGMAKPHLSLELPTNIQHVSNKMLSETLLLQNEDKIIASAVKASQNHTDTTDNAAYAAASSKAMSDTTELVSSVLNDPTSVEARTCCASILNVFHENCSITEEEELSDKRLFISVFIIAVCGLVKSLIRHFHLRWLPEAAGCILVGGKYSPCVNRCLTISLFISHRHCHSCL